MIDNEKVEKLKSLLKELFQFDNGDLDFGIYRIINIKRKEISEFIEKELFEIINVNIKNLGDNADFKKSLEKLQKEIEMTFGCNIHEAKTKYPETPKVKDYIYKEKELTAKDKEKEIEEQIYEDIITFFSRYYDKGDFISKKRYSKDNKYSIPYNGEEVFLHWANNDQYYIKTCENFNNYQFNLGSLKVNFEMLSEDVKTEKDNIKESEKKYFVVNDAFYESNKRNLTVQFGYRSLNEDENNIITSLIDKKNISKEEVNLYNLRKINERIGIYGLSELQKKHIKIDGEYSDRTEIEWHLNKYTTKNTTDYFIHKNLKRFLIQELDFYIKNEILQIDDIESKENLILNINKIKTFKYICLRIIEFLSQIEDFQKKLWEKRKFIIESNYVITLDKISEYCSEEFLESIINVILTNKIQLEEWKLLFDLDIRSKNDLKYSEIQTKLNDNGNTWKKLPIDTKYFSEEFKFDLLSRISNLDEKLNGILFHSENWQALNLIHEKYQEKIKCCYIDPPYNTSEESFLYKNNYKDSSWMSMINDRINLAKGFLDDNGTIGICIDDTELFNLKLSADAIYSSENYIGTLVIQVNPRGRTRDTFFATCHDYVIFYAKNIEEAKIFDLDLTEDQVKAFKMKDNDSEYRLLPFRRSGGLSTPAERPNSFYPIYYNKNTGRIDVDEFPDSIKIYPLDSKGVKRVWRQTRPSLMNAVKRGDIVIKENNGEYTVLMKDRIKEGRKPKTMWIDSKYDASSHGTIMITNLFGDTKLFSYPKSLYATMDTLRVQTKGYDEAIVLDFFAGSGTTGHAVLYLNNEGYNMKFILVEMGKYFNSVLNPRMKKVLYSFNWKDGKPQDMDSIGGFFKYHELEQYEDSLNNIDFDEPNILAKKSKNYKIKYMLEFETIGSKVLLNLDDLNNPFNYKLKFEENNRLKERNIDLVETFNYLSGINVKSIKKINNGPSTYVIVKGDRNEKDVIVIWRNTQDDFDPIKDKDFVENEILKDEYDEILVNGNSLINNAKSIDEIFKSNMFGGVKWEKYKRNSNTI